MSFFNPFHMKGKPKIEDLETLESGGWGEQIEEDWTDA